MIEDVLDHHILPRFEQLYARSVALDAAAQKDCAPEAEPLRAAYHAAFDAWIAVSHLRFGPSERDERAFALAFWPDPRGATPKVLRRLIAQQDEVVAAGGKYAEVSVAGRGFYALEFLLYDDQILALRDRAGDGDYHCRLLRAVTADIAVNAKAIWDDWRMGYRDTMLTSGPQAVYRSEREVLQELFKALGSGLQFTSDMRLGRPLGTFERPRPKRAEARRAQRSLRHVSAALAALRDLALRLAQDKPAISEPLQAAFARSLNRVSQLDDPVFAAVSTPQGRIRVEALQQSVDDIRDLVSSTLGPELGVRAGFNSMDGD